MCGVRDLAASLNRLQARYHQTYQVAQVVSCGGMIGSAIAYPLDAIEGRQYSNVLFATFIVSATMWHALSLGAFIDYGIYTVPSGLVVMLLVVTFAGPFRADLAAWLPLSAVTLSFITVAINSARQRRRADAVAPDGHGGNTSPPGGYGWEQQHRGHQPTVLDRFLNESGPTYLRWSSFPQATFTEGSRGTTLTLSSTPAQARPSWGSQVLGFFVDPMALRASQQPSRRSSRSSLGESHVGAAAAAPLGGGEDLPPDAERGLTSPLLGGSG